MTFEPQDVTGEADKTAMHGSRQAAKMLADLRSLRHSIILAWRERSIMLTREEQQELRAEIRDTCDLLSSLTSGD